MYQTYMNQFQQLTLYLPTAMFIRRLITLRRLAHLHYITFHRLGFITSGISAYWTNDYFEDQRSKLSLVESRTLCLFLRTCDCACSCIWPTVYTALCQSILSKRIKLSRLRLKEHKGQHWILFITDVEVMLRRNSTQKCVVAAVFQLFIHQHDDTLNCIMIQ